MRFISLCLFALLVAEVSFAQPSPLIAPAPSATPSSTPKPEADDAALLAPPAAPKLDPAKAEIHRNKARLLIEQKNWEQALQEIRQATQLNPNSQDGWLVHGTVAQRLEHQQEAYDAFNKYLALNPPADKAAAVRQRVAELELKLEKERNDLAIQKANEDAARAKRTGPLGSGFFIGYSSYKPEFSTSSDLNSTLDNLYDFGFRFGRFDFGFQFGTGTVDQVTVREEEDNTLVGTFTDGKHTFIDFFFRGNIPLGEPQGGSAGHGFYLPLQMGMFLQNVKFDKLYGNFGFDFGTGLNYRYYTGSSIVFDVMGLYHLGLPFWKMQNNDRDILAIYNENGERITGSPSGTELRGSIVILF